MIRKLTIGEPFWRNAVVVRDMRVRLRGPRAFWNQAFYLGLLSLITLAGYATAIAYVLFLGILALTVVQLLAGRLLVHYRS